MTESWGKYEEDYSSYIRFEKRLSGNTEEAYVRDFHKLADFMGDTPPERVVMGDIELFLADTYDKNVKRSTQARTLSSVRSFFNFLLVNDKIEILPTEFIESPRMKRSLPDTISTDEIVAMIDSIDLSNPLGHRNQSIIETLYSCGLRVSELVNLRLSDMFLEEGFVRVTGKGDKQRMVPINDEAIRKIKLYLEQRNLMPIETKHKDFVFLNNKGRKLTRVMIFIIIKECARAAGIVKNISPHTLRHSFAGHLVQGGADIRVVQEMLGHESIATTEIYTHLENEHLREEIEKLH